MLGVCFAQSSAQQDTTIKVQVRRVPVDVIVTDAHGQPVTDLKKEDFTLLESKVAQEITGFSVEKVSADHSAVAPPPKGFLTNASLSGAASSDLTVILFDELNTSFSDAAYARFRLEKLLKQPQLKGHPIALLVMNRDLVRLHDFTDDPESLLLAFKRHKPFMPTLAEDEFPDLWQNSSDATGPSTTDLVSQAEREYRDVFGKYNVLNRAEQTLASLRVLAHTLHDRPGRKRLIWLSGGFPLTFEESGLQSTSLAGQRIRTTDVGLQRSLEATSLALTDARISVYPIDARGLMADPKWSASNQRIGNTIFSPTDNQAAMATLAEQTGGKFYKNRNDLDGAAVDAVNDGTYYYALTYRPTDTKWDGKFRKIEVRVNRPGVQVRQRRGYYASKDGEEESKGASLDDAAIDPLQRNELEFAAAGARLSESAAKFIVILSPNSIPLPKSAADFSASVELVTVQGSGTGQAFISKPQPIELKVDEAHYAKVRQNGLPFSVTCPIKGKSNRFRLIIRDRDTGKIGSLDIPLQTAPRT